MKIFSILTSLPKFAHFLSSLLHLRMKSLNYVLKFKCSQNIWNLHTWIRNTYSNWYEMDHQKSDTHNNHSLIDFQREPKFCREIAIGNLLKNELNIMKSLFNTLPKWKYSVSKLLLLLVLSACMYVLAFQDQHILSKWNIFSQSCYCCLLSLLICNRFERIFHFERVCWSWETNACIRIERTGNNNSFEIEYFTLGRCAGCSIKD